MKITNTEKINNTTTKYTVELDRDAWVKKQAEVRKNLIKNLVIPGFRKGHVPEAKANEYIPTTEVMDKALNQILNSQIDAFFANEKVSSNKEIIEDTLKVGIKDIDEGKVIVELIFDNKPNVTLPDYKNIKLNYTKPVVTDEEINAEINRLMSNDRTYAPKADNTIAKGDMVTFDFKGFLDNTAFPGGEATDYKLEIGSGQFIPGFEDKMIGLKVGDKTKIDVTFPTDYHAKELAGKPVVFELNIKKVETISKPTLDAGYIAKLNIPSVLNEVQLKEHIKKDIFEYKNYSAKQTAIEQINEFITTNTKTDFIPQGLLDKEIKNLKADFENKAKENKQSLEDYVKSLKYKTMDDFNNKMHESAVKALNFVFAFDKLITELKLEPSEKQINEELENISKLYQTKVEEIKKNSMLIDRISTYLTQKLLYDKLIELNTTK